MAATTGRFASTRRADNRVDCDADDLEAKVEVYSTGSDERPLVEKTIRKIIATILILTTPSAFVTLGKPS